MTTVTAEQAEGGAEDVGARVRRLREAKGLSLEDAVALLAGHMDKSGLAKRERGETRWTADDLRAMAKALSVPVAELFGE